MYASQKTSRVLSVDLDSGKVVDLASNRVEGSKAPADLKRGPTALEALVESRSLWLGRVDYAIRAYDGITGHERFNLTYSELTPLTGRTLDPEEDSEGEVATRGVVYLSSPLNRRAVLSLISTPQGRVYFADKTGLSYNSIDLGSTVSQAFSVRPRRTAAGTAVLATAEYDMRPLRIGYRMSVGAEAEAAGPEGKLDVAVVRHLRDGGLYAIELASGPTAEVIAGSKQNLQLPSPALDPPAHAGEYESWDLFTDECPVEAGVALFVSCDKRDACVHPSVCDLQRDGRQPLSTQMSSDGSRSILRYSGFSSAVDRETSERMFGEEIAHLHDKPMSVPAPVTRRSLGLSGYLIDLLSALDVLLFRLFTALLAVAAVIGVVNLVGTEQFLSRSFLETVRYVSRLAGAGSNEAQRLSPEEDVDTVAAIAEVAGKDDPCYVVVDGKTMSKVGSLLVSDSVLGYGSHGTVVLLGDLNGRKVAVKRMLSQFTSSADREISLLIRSDGHPNVVRYFLREEKAEFVYLALQLCEMSLRDFISSVTKAQESQRLRAAAASGSKVAATFASALSKNYSRQSRLGALPAIEFGDVAVSDSTRLALLQLADGLAHLHSKRIMHRDIKPHNILLAFSDENCDIKGSSGPIVSVTSIGRYLLKISDMGLSKQVEKDHGSFASMSFLGDRDPKGCSESTCESANNPVGTVGWQAPELMHHRRSSSNEGDMVAEGSEKQHKQLRFQTVDIFALGCVLHYVMVPGEHPYGEWFEREANIMNANLNLSHMKLVPDALDLLQRMLANDPRNRPTALQVSRHPFFWTNAQRLDFLVTLSDRLEREPIGSPINLAMEANAAAIVGRHWDRKLHPNLLEDMGKYRKYDTSSVRDCLRVIRNKKHHFLELGETIKSLLSPMPDGFVVHFEKRFPNLLMHAVRVVSCSLHADKDFSRIFSPIASMFSTEAGRCDHITACSAFGVAAAVTSVLETSKGAPRDTDVDMVWCGSSLAASHGVRGWWKSSAFWETSFVSMHFKSKPRPSHLTKSSSDPKYRSRLCTHWEQSSGTGCPMRKKGKCIFAHGPLELRIKESRKDKWGTRAAADSIFVDNRSSGGEDVLGAARAIEKIRVIEGSVSDFEKSAKSRGHMGSFNQKKEVAYQNGPPTGRPSDYVI